MRGKLLGFPSLFRVLRVTPAPAGKTLCPRCLSRRSWDHPRACGENTVCSRQCRLRIGSPPRMRGKLVRAAGSVAIRRITPAHAGKTCLHPPFRHSVWDHPRACGENIVGAFVLAQALGSPPRMRGKLFFVQYFLEFVGITPAHAGKTLSASEQHKNGKDHPRACGENLLYGL